MMEGGKKRRRKKSPSANQEMGDLEDRISGLPDPLISHILSFLQMQDVIKTSLLARRWRYLWTTVPVLDFGSSWTWRIMTFIAYSFLRYEGGKIRKFHAQANDWVEDCDIDSWFHFTTKHGVEELDIMGYSDDDDDGNPLYYRMPRFLDYGSLRVLRLQCCALDLRASDCFPSLRQLHLHDVDFTDINTSSCPLLEELVMEDCRNSRNICAPNEKLRYLKDQNEFEGHNELEIYAPYLLSMEFDGSLRPFYNLKNVSSVKSAIIDIFMVPFGTKFGDPEPGEVMLDLIKNLGHAKTLKLSEDSLQILGCEKIFRMPYLSTSSLEVDISFGNKSGLTMIASLLNRTRRLENFIIRNKSEKFLRDYGDDISWKLLGLALQHLQLRTVTIHGFLEGWSLSDSSLNLDKIIVNLEKGEMKLIRLLLNSCKVLDKLVIRAGEMSCQPSYYESRLERKRKNEKGFLELFLSLKSKLLLLPRTSVNAVVQLAWNM